MRASLRFKGFRSAIPPFLYMEHVARCNCVSAQERRCRLALNTSHFLTKAAYTFCFVLYYCTLRLDTERRFCCFFLLSIIRILIPSGRYEYPPGSGQVLSVVRVYQCTQHFDFYGFWATKVDNDCMRQCNQCRFSNFYSILTYH